MASTEIISLFGRIVGKKMLFAYKLFFCFQTLSWFIFWGKMLLANDWTCSWVFVIGLRPSEFSLKKPPLQVLKWSVWENLLWLFNDLMSLQIALYRFMEYLVVCLEVLCIGFYHMSKKVGPCDAFIWLNGEGSRQGNCKNRTDIAPIHKCLAATHHGPFFALQLPEAAIPEREATADIGRRDVGMKMCEVCEAKWKHCPQNYSGHGFVSDL